ncbi:MAG: YncE family protein [Bacteroidales bacterium]|nr:YncE family protein [Bacteroidales bacterium]
MKRQLLLLAVIFAIVIASCSKKSVSDDSPVIPPSGDTIQPGGDTIQPSLYQGLFILNEGTFTYANSSLSYYDIETGTVENNIFFRVNDAPIGDVGQSLTKVGDDLYIVVNNSKYIYKVDAQSIVYKAKIEGFTSPRYMLPVSSDKAYVSDLESLGLWSLNLNTLEKTFIETGNTTEAMVKVGNEVFVSNWSNYYPSQIGITTSNKTIQVIDCERDTIVATIEVAQEPNAMVVDKNDHIWVSCSGSYNNVQDPALICIDPATRTVIKRFNFTPGADYPSGLAIDGTGENVFFMNGGYGTLNVYKMSVDANEFPANPFISANGKLFYNLKVNPDNGDIYITDAKDYVSNGDLLRYSADGTLLATATLGIIPSYMLFN